MTKTKKAVKEVNKMADREILKAQIEAKKAKIKEWLGVEVYGYTRRKILLSAIVVVVVTLAVS